MITQPLQQTATQVQPIERRLYSVGEDVLAGDMLKPEQALTIWRVAKSNHLSTVIIQANGQFITEQVFSKVRPGPFKPWSHRNIDGYHRTEFPEYQNILGVAA